MAVYRPRNVRQADGSRFQWENCNMAAAATALDRHTLGRLHSTGGKMRSCQYDQVGGTDLNDAKTAWARCYGQYLDVRLGISWNTFIATVKSGRGAILSGWYGMIPNVYSSQPSFNGNHGVFINEIRADGALLMFDPLSNTGEKWVPQSIMKSYAGNLSLGRRAVGFGYCYSAFTRNTGGVTVPAPVPHPVPSGVVFRFGGQPTNRGNYITIGGANVRRSPYVRSDNIIKVVPKGYRFHCSQTTKVGTNFGGNSRWYGDSTGTVWIHSSLARLV